MSGFTTADIPDLTGQTVIVTGASSGIGLETAKALAAHGARVILAVRDEARGRQGRGHPAGPGARHEVRLLDLASLESVRAFARDWSGPVDLLINNAGVMIPPLSRTADGFELQFGTNHLGHFALTNLLLPHVTGRVVTVSSNAHRAGRIDFDDLNWERKRYRAWRAYGQSKLANLLFTAELQRRLTEAGSPVLSMAAHPGYAATNLQSHSGSRLMELRHGQARQPPARPGRGRRRPADPLRGHGRPARQQLRRPVRLRRHARRPRPLRPLEGRQRRRGRPPPLAGLRAADRRDFPGNSTPVGISRTGACAAPKTPAGRPRPRRAGAQG